MYYCCSSIHQLSNFGHYGALSIINFDKMMAQVKKCSFEPLRKLQMLFKCEFHADEENAIEFQF
jgi:hypothetical protein